MAHYLFHFYYFDFFTFIFSFYFYPFFVPCSEVFSIFLVLKCLIYHTMYQNSKDNFGTNKHIDIKGVIDKVNFYIQLYSFMAYLFWCKVVNFPWKVDVLHPTFQYLGVKSETFVVCRAVKVLLGPATSLVIKMQRKKPAFSDYKGKR